MNTRRILVSVSVVGVAATLIAVTKEQWTYGLALYGGSVVAILALLRRALRERHGTATRDQASSGATRPPAQDAGALVD